MDTSPLTPSCLSLPPINPRNKEIKYFYCSYPNCGFKAKIKDYVINHEKRHNPSLQLRIRCKVCPFKIFESLVSFLHHMSCHHLDKLLCSWCLFYAQDLAEFKAHILTHNTFKSVQTKRKPTESDLRCGTCSRTFLSQYSLSVHQQKNRCKPNPYTTSLSSSSAQKIQVQQEIPYESQASVEKQTDECSHDQTEDPGLSNRISHILESYKARASKSSIKIHHEIQPEIQAVTQEKDGEGRNKRKRIARVNRAIACIDCNFKTSALSHMRRHHCLHSGERPFKCPNIGCDCRFRWSGNLSRHQKKSCRGRKIQRTTTTNIEAQDKSGSGSDIECGNKTQVTEESSSSSMALACMLCNFIGDSVSSALKHSRQHKTPVILLNRI